MGGYFPGPLGIAAFAGIKFAGYAAAALALKKIEPVITASALKIAGIRTGLGVVMGIPATLIGVSLVSAIHPKFTDLEGYFVLAAVRLGIWALLLYMLTKQSGISRPRLLLLAALGAACSCLLDWPAFHLASVAPGQIPVC